MKANGDTRQSLDQCSCSIDVIATILSYDKYVAAETVASVTQQAGQIATCSATRRSRATRWTNCAAPRRKRKCGASDRHQSSNPGGQARRVCQAARRLARNGAIAQFVAQ